MRPLESFQHKLKQSQVVKPSLILKDSGLNLKGLAKACKDEEKLGIRAAIRMQSEYLPESVLSFLAIKLKNIYLQLENDMYIESEPCFRIDYKRSKDIDQAQEHLSDLFETVSELLSASSRAKVDQTYTPHPDEPQTHRHQPVGALEGNIASNARVNPEAFIQLIKE